MNSVYLCRKTINIVYIHVERRTINIVYIHVQKAINCVYAHVRNTKGSVLIQENMS